MIQYAIDIQKLIHVLLTKADKLSNNQQANTLRQTKKFLSSLWSLLQSPPFFRFFEI